MSLPTLAERIREEREWISATCEQLAGMLGEPVGVVEAWEAGESAPTGEQMVRLTGLLGLSVERLHGAPLRSGSGDVLFCGSGDLTHEDRFQVARFAEYLRHRGSVSAKTPEGAS